MTSDLLSFSPTQLAQLDDIADSVLDITILFQVGGANNMVIELETESVQCL